MVTSRNKLYVKLLTVYVLFLTSVFILFKNSSLIDITQTEWVLFFIIVLGIGFLLYSKKEVEKEVIKNQYKYLRNTYRIGVLILIIGPISLFFMTPLYMLYAVFVVVRIVTGLIYLFLKRELLW